MVNIYMLLFYSFCYYVFMKAIRRGTLAFKILKGIGLTGLFLISMSNPRFGVQLLTGFKEYNKREKQKFRESLYYLKKRGLVKIIENSSGGFTAKLSKTGEKMLESIDIDCLELKNKEFDGKWRVVIFDVPVRLNIKRHAFTERLKTLGFIMVQRSVWICPFRCRKELAMLTQFYEIEKYVTYLETSFVDNEEAWKKEFSLIKLVA